MYKLEYRGSVKKELRKLSEKDRVIIFDKISALVKKPLPEGATKLKGLPGLHRIRHGDYRIIYQIKNKLLIIVVVRIGHRSDVYRNL